MTQNTNAITIVTTDVLEIAYEGWGTPDGSPVVLQTGADGVLGAPVDNDHSRVIGPHGQERLPNVGQNVPQEGPREFAWAVLDLTEAS